MECFPEAAERNNITCNEEKSLFSTRRLAILGSIVEEGKIRLDPERLRPLRELPVPNSIKSLNRCKGLFVYYSQWIPGFYDRMKPINSSKTCPLSTEALATFESLKKRFEELAQISAVRLFSTLELGGGGGGGGSPEKNSDSSVSELSALATLRPIWGRCGQGAFELSLPQIRHFFFLEKPLRVWIYLLRKYAYRDFFISS